MNITLLELQQLVGHLNFACKAIMLGQAFLHWLCDNMKGDKLLHHRLWQEFLPRPVVFSSDSRTSEWRQSFTFTLMQLDHWILASISAETDMWMNGHSL